MAKGEISIVNGKIPKEEGDIEETNYNMFTDGDVQNTDNHIDGNISETDKDSELGEKDKEDEIDDRDPDRGGWDSKADFILACIGYAVGIGNIWRFPYMVYKNGGGAFLIPYFLFMVILGIPMFMLEISLGQYLQQGGITVWEIIPCFKGIGYGSATISCILNIYYIIIIAWVNIYLVCSFFPTLPWTICDGWWNDIWCYDYATHNTTSNGTQFITGEYNNITIDIAHADSPAEQFWNNFVLQISDGIHEIGSLVWTLVASLLVSWIICYACIVKGVKTTGKIVWFTTTFPYVVMTCLLIRAATLPGASDGIYYYLVPDWSKLLEIQIWVDAASQILFTLAIGIASLISLGSYNKYHNNTVIDSTIVCVVNCLTSFYCGFMIFATLGFMAYVQGVEVDEVVDSGPGLTFITVPTAIAEMPGANFWAVLFFFMLFLMGMDSQFCVVEGLYTALADEYPKYLRANRALSLAILAFVYFLLGLPCCTNAGMYFFELMNTLGAAGYVLLWMAMWECIAICYFYGIKKFMLGLTDMLQRKPSYAWAVSWAFVIPVTLIIIQVFSLVGWDGMYYGDYYRYPVWGEVLGWLMAAASMHWIVTYFIYSLIVTPGTLKERWYTVNHPAPYIKLRGLDDGDEHDGIEKDNDDDIDSDSPNGSNNSVPPCYENAMVVEMSDM
ncbi:sodium- and chloride-dependent GABA transporter 1-like [Saccoglossus kowalevskii]|uniref:Transporter n=1 Tax=Saccoglossus kowalevskii TaxID=10224 RepID=A0ABM0MMS0_SACKO|nr:PREDICTED: sodium- and chloride-dependent creatine transporter 1-like [Saccoglossus kowalevskii]